MFRLGAIISLVLLAAGPADAALSDGPAPSAGKVVSDHLGQPDRDQQKAKNVQRNAQDNPILVKIVETDQTRREGAQQAAYENVEAENERVIANFTMVLGVAALIQLAAAGVQIYWMWRTVADGNVEHIATNRAFAFVKAIDMLDAVDGNDTTVTWQINPQWSNSGKTPTVGAIIQTNFVVIDGELPDGFPYAYGNVARTIFIGPGADVRGGVLDIPANAVSQAMDGKSLIYVWGTIKYRDIFAGTPQHFTNFCFKIEVRRTREGAVMAFVPYREHNNTDYEMPKAS